MSLLPPPDERLWTLNAVRVPDGVDEAAVRRRLLEEYAIEIGAGLGPLAGKIWRVGLMGAGSTQANVDRLLTASKARAAARVKRWRRAEAAAVSQAISAAWTSAILAAALSATPRYIYLTLPDVRPLRTTNPEDDSVHRAARARSAARGEAVASEQRWVPYARISPNLKRAVLVTEDSAFWKHEGIDFDAAARSRWRSTSSGWNSRAARSTITQQLAKNLYLSPSKNPIRKLRELLIARRLEAELSKQRILELYLNVIEWGDGIYGAEAAARALLSQVGRGACRRRSRRCSRPRSRNPRLFDPGASDRAPAPAPADDHAPHGRRHAAAWCCRSEPEPASPIDGARTLRGIADDAARIACCPRTSPARGSRCAVAEWDPGGNPRRRSRRKQCL